MKIKLSKEEIERISKNPDSKVEISDPWWVIVAKVVAYLCGLLLAGYGTASAANAMNLF